MLITVKFCKWHLLLAGEHALLLGISVSILQALYVGAMKITMSWEVLQLFTFAHLDLKMNKMGPAEYNVMGGTFPVQGGSLVGLMHSVFLLHLSQ